MDVKIKYHTIKPTFLIFSFQVFCKRLFIFLLATALLVSCESGDDDAASAFLSPSESIARMEIEDGFKVEVAAAEPLLNSPTTMIFDEQGRIWLTEMPSFMLDTLGSGEEKPTGKIIILTDKDQDGIYETRTEFLDGLVMPRALCLIDNGLLVGEPPYLWFIEIKNNKPGNKTLIDSAYAVGGDVEHQPNGLLRGMDNWVYNAKSDKRYKKIGDKWITEKTHFRGQWGIAQDNYGRLYYNHNSANVLGDYMLPGVGANNKNQKHVFGFHEIVVASNRVYPARATPGVNRGYMEGVLDDSLRLVNFTAASALTIYRGSLFAKQYDFNAFVPEPAANLIKRNILTEDNNRVIGHEAYVGKEFLRSKDERFRPVTVTNGPDGALYVVDMYRGIIQHKTYLSDYLKGIIKDKNLQNSTAVGRIYRIVPKGKKYAMVTLPNNQMELVNFLQHKNGWVRDKAQQLIIDQKRYETIPALHSLLKESQSSLTRIHALWTLEGLQALTIEDVLPLYGSDDWHVRIHALSATSGLINSSNYQLIIPLVEQMMNESDAYTGPYLAYLVHKFEQLDATLYLKWTDQLLASYANNSLVSAAILSGQQDKEVVFLQRLDKNGIDSSTHIYKDIKEILKTIDESKADVNTKAAAAKYAKGAAIYNSICASCHGKDGNGLESLAPTLNKSDWVLGKKDKVIATVLFGLSGPIIVNGVTPNVTGDMPGIGQNPKFSDEDIAQITSYIRNAWSNTAGGISKDDVRKIREQFVDRKHAFTMKEINKLMQQ